MYKTAAEAVLALGPFGDQKLNTLAREYLKESDPAKKEQLFKKIEQQYPGNWGANNTISEQADFVIDAFKDDLQKVDDENGETFGDDLT